MAKERATDLFVAKLLEQAGIEYEAEESSINEIKDALKTASKRQTGQHGSPEYTAVVEDYVLIVEDKADTDKHILMTSDGELSLEPPATTSYAVNGAVWYAMKVAEQTTYEKVFAIGASGDEKHHKIQPVFISSNGKAILLDEVETFANFNKENIQYYYLEMVEGQKPDEEIQLEKVIEHASTLHEDLRNYGQLGETEKPLVVSAILLALMDKSFSLNQLTGDTVKSDGKVIFEALESHLRRIQVTPDTKREIILNQFTLIKDRTQLNEKNPNLGKTPLKHFAEFLEKNILRSIRANVPEDVLGRFYSEFVRYSGGDGQSLGVVLTPRHITELFCDLLKVGPEDTIFDPCSGTAGFLISAMHIMLQKAGNAAEQEDIKQNRIHGIEIRSDMFAIATTNMILRGDGKSNLRCADFLKEDPAKLQTSVCATVGMMNPPYSQAKSKTTANLSEIKFVKHLLDSLTVGGRAAIIVPQPVMTGKTKEDQKVKEAVLKNHTLEGVITLNKNTFYRVGVNPCIAIFTTHKAHDPKKQVRFVNFEDDGFVVKKHIGLVETEAAKDRRLHLLNCWFGKDVAPSKFMVESTICASDEWLHSYFYFNDEMPDESDFIKSVADYLTFEFDMVVHGREYLFKKEAADA